MIAAGRPARPVVPGRAPTAQTYHWPAKFSGSVHRSNKYIASGSSTFSPSRNAVVGVVRRHQHVDGPIRRVEVAGDQRAHLLRLVVIGVVVAGDNA